EPPPKAVPYQAVTRPEDGCHLALSIEKLSKGFSPERPFVIWALGSSFTDFLGNGEELIAELRKRFPNAPPIVYKKMVGGSTPYNMLRGWARHLVIPDHPDLVLIYNFGNTENLKKLFAELRSKTTADIIVGSLHWCRRHETAWPDPEIPIPKHVDPKTLREACQEYAVEFVETRRDITAYMLANHLMIQDLLVDTVHQNPYMAKMINESFAAHFNSQATFSYDPRSRERRLEAEAPNSPIRKAGWKTSEDGQSLISAPSAGQASEITIEFTGTRIDLIAQRSPDGGMVSVWLDGKPGNQIEAFHAGYIQPDQNNFIDIKSSITDMRRVISDRCPHGIELGSNIVPQNWTVTMLSDQGDYELTGSRTGADGKGNAFQPFTSNSRQISIPPDLWRLAKTNRTGDRFTFAVKRNSVEQIDFKGTPGKFRICITDQLPNKSHQLTLKIQGGSKVTLDAFDVFEPPLKSIEEKQ
ncbi:MAG: SGNH/GDSL hydrolase family protein, partial [Lentisphaeria bacterium]